MFNPDIYSYRLSSLISSIIGTTVTVRCILSSEENLLPTCSMLIMDILVKMDDGSIANVEIQKIPYAFPGERMSCYSSDLLLRQYSRVKREKGRDFTYKGMKKVYTIVIFEKSPSIFKTEQLSNIYIHAGKTTFNSGLTINMLQEYFIVSLDVFKENTYPKYTYTQNAWLSLLTAETIDDLEQIIIKYPWMESICIDMSKISI